MGADGVAFEKLIDTVRRLRGPDGCPWDREQTRISILPSFIEELYEYIDAVHDDDARGMQEELGDLCLHIAFQACLAEEDGRFFLRDALNGIIEKLIRRHPHVFADVSADTPEEVLKNWEMIKKREKGDDARASVLDGIPRHLPPLIRAHAVQDKARKVGFDWDHIDAVMAKVEEELAEVSQAIAENDHDKIEDELGDLLFAVVNVARFTDVEPSRALERTVKKFMRRFRAIEDALAEKGMTPAMASFEELDGLWETTKRDERANESS